MNNKTLRIECLFSVWWSKKGTLLALAILAGGGGGLYAYSQPDRWRATATVEFAFDAPKIIPSAYVDANGKTYTQSLSGKPFVALAMGGGAPAEVHAKLRKRMRLTYENRSLQATVEGFDAKLVASITDTLISDLLLDLAPIGDLSTIRQELGRLDTGTPALPVPDVSTIRELAMLEARLDLARQREEFIRDYLGPGVPEAFLARSEIATLQTQWTRFFDSPACIRIFRLTALGHGNSNAWERLIRAERLRQYIAASEVEKPSIRNLVERNIIHRSTAADSIEFAGPNRPLIVALWASSALFIAGLLIAVRNCKLVSPAETGPIISQTGSAAGFRTEHHDGN